MEGFAKELLERLSLADGTLSLLSWVLDREFLADVFEEFRGRSYESELAFATLVALIQDALLEHEGSGHQAMLRSDELTVSIQATYRKLSRVPISLSLGFFACASDRLQEVFPDGAATSLPASLRAFDVCAIDGKKIKRVAKRLKPTRRYSGTPLGGKTLAALDLRKGLMVAFNAHPDGETNDAPLIPGLLPQVRERSSGPILWIADRQFCDLRQPLLFSEGNDAYLVRYHPKNSFERTSNVAVRQGVDSQGRRYLEEWGHLGKAKNKRLSVRRITLYREGEEEVILVTSLLDADQYPATDLLDAYLARWGIERVFQQVTEVFHLRQLISSSPEGTIFQFGFCMLLYNLIQVVRAYIANAQRKPAETISAEKLFYDIHRELISLSTLTDAAEIVDHFHPVATASELKPYLEQLLASAWEDRWIKSPKKKIPKKSDPKKTIQGGHTSIYRILRTEKQQTVKNE